MKWLGACEKGDDAQKYRTRISTYMKMTHISTSVLLSLFKQGSGMSNFNVSSKYLIRPRLVSAVARQSYLTSHQSAHRGSFDVHLRNMCRAKTCSLRHFWASRRKMYAPIRSFLQPFFREKVFYEILLVSGGGKFEASLPQGYKNRNHKSTNSLSSPPAQQPCGKNHSPSFLRHGDRTRNPGSSLHLKASIFFP